MNRMLMVLLVVTVFVVGLLIWVITQQRRPLTSTPATGNEAQQQEPNPRYKEK